MKINDVLKDRENSIVNIINDKLTLSVFSELAKKLNNVNEINFIIRDTAYIPSGREIAREFEMNQNITDLLIHIIVETKFDKEWQDLSDVEQIKIECGELHFKAVADDVKFKWANSYKDFMDKVESD